MPSGAVVFEAIEGSNDFIFKYFNRTAEKIDATKKQTVLGRRVTEVFPGAEPLGLLGKLKNVWETGRADYLPASLY